MLDITHLAIYNTNMETEKAYLNQYFELCIGWERLKIKPDTALKEQHEKMQDLRQKALTQSGLSNNELTFICMCRQYHISRKINSRMFSLIY